MEAKNTTDESYIEAKKKVKIIRGFYIHLGIFLLVNTIVLLVLSMIESNDDMFWEYYPIAGWGIAIALHYFLVFGFDYVFGKNWEERKIRELIDRDSNKKI